MYDGSPNDNNRYICHVCLSLSGSRVYQVWHNQAIANDAHKFFSQVAEYFENQEGARLLACVLFQVVEDRTHKYERWFAEVAGKVLHIGGQVAYWATEADAQSGVITYLKMHGM